ncbi:MAG: site-specific integrase [Bacteroidales bacterium]|nr:site-specific integrase [Bacteroidales bacterium]
MATIRSILKSSRDADGRYPILLCISDRGKRAYFSTGFTATEKEFEVTKDGGRYIQGKGIKKFYVDRKEEDGSIKSYSNMEANDKLATLETRAKEILRKYNEDHTSWGFEQFRSDFTNAPKRELFLTYAEEVMEKEYRAKGQFQKASIMEDAIQSLKNYDGQLARKAFQDITPKYLEGYVSFCRNKGNGNGTISIRLREIRRIFNLAIGERIVKPELYPFSSGKEDGKVRLPKVELSKTDQYLTEDSLRVIAKAVMDDQILERTRHLFLFSFYCRGINWKDMALLTKSSFRLAMVTDETTKTSKEVTMLQYRRSKTKGTFDILVTSNIQRELDWFKENTVLYEDYVLPIISMEVKPEDLDEYLKQRRKRFNRSLRTLAKKLEFPESQQNITIYTARHSFAMTLQTADKPIEIISQALGHQSVETTKHYLAKFSTTKMAEETDINLLDD